MTQDRQKTPARATWLRSARLRLALLLTVAILPLGLITLLLSRDSAVSAREISERALLGDAIRVAAAQRSVILTAMGQARALVPLVQSVPPGNAACSALMSQVAGSGTGIVFAGFASPDGKLKCTSDGNAYDMSDHPLRTSEAPGGAILSGSAVFPLPGTLLTVQPVYRTIPAESGIASQRTKVGTIVLALPERALLATDAIPGAEPAALDIATLNRAGELLWSSPLAPGRTVGPADDAARMGLPASVDIADLANQPAHGLSALSGYGDRRTYASVPIVGGEIVTLASWQPGSLYDDPLARPLTLGLLLPVLMWVLSLLVAFITVNRLFLRPLAALGQRMRAFTAGERTLPPFRAEGAPDELSDLAVSFDAMTARIESDESRLEKAVHDQEVLLKEVHHRVKNNLQLIASILNMQIRQHRSPENRAVLKRVQDRVMSLATVHQHLYRTPALSALRADHLISEIVNRKLAEAGDIGGLLEVETEFTPVRLYPDQAVPLALLVGEGVTNVFHHVGRPAGGGRPWMRVGLTQSPDGTVELEIANSGGEKLAEAQAQFQAGLGARLIDAFARQLEGTLINEREADAAWSLRLNFRAQAFTAQSAPAEAPDTGARPGEEPPGAPPAAPDP